MRRTCAGPALLASTPALGPPCFYPCPVLQVKRPETFNETFEGAWLWGYGMGLHLIKGQPVPRSKHIDPKSDHLSFQVWQQGWEIVLAGCLPWAAGSCSFRRLPQAALLPPRYHHLCVG